MQDITFWENVDINQRYYLILDPMEAGYLEPAPLHDQGNAEEGQGILWVKETPDSEPSRFIYVFPEDVALVEGDNP